MPRQGSHDIAVCIVCGQSMLRSCLSHGSETSDAGGVNVVCTLESSDASTELGPRPAVSSWACPRERLSRGKAMQEAY